MKDELPCLTLNTATAPTRDRNSGARRAAGLSPITASKRGPAVTFLEPEESQADPRSRVTRAEESKFPDREDRFDRPGLHRPQRLTDVRQRGGEPLVTEALPVGFAVPQGHDAPAAGHRPRHADPEPSRQRTLRIQPLRQSRILLGRHASGLTHYQDCHFSRLLTHGRGSFLIRPRLPAPDRLNIEPSCPTGTQVP